MSTANSNGGNLTASCFLSWIDVPFDVPQEESSEYETDSEEEDGPGEVILEAQKRWEDWG